MEVKQGLKSGPHNQDAGEELHIKGKCAQVSPIYQSKQWEARHTSSDHVALMSAKEHDPPALPLTFLWGSLNSLPPIAFAAVGLAAQHLCKLKLQIHRQSETREFFPCQENEIPLESSRIGKRQPTNEFNFGQTPMKLWKLWEEPSKNAYQLILLLFPLT